MLVSSSSGFVVLPLRSTTVDALCFLALVCYIGLY